jgi:glucose/arabinose dehydrogenase
MFVWVSPKRVCTIEQGTAIRGLLLSSSLVIAASAACLADDVRTGSAAFSDWRRDVPGVRRLITPGDLQPPEADAQAENSPAIVPRPSGALPKVPVGFVVDVFASGLNDPRVIRIAPNGDVFVAESGGGRWRCVAGYRPSA